MAAVLNLVKNRIDLVRGTELERKVKEATSNENWGASSTLKNEIARATFDYESYKEVVPLIWKRLSEDGKNWRIVFKTLLLLEHLFRLGSERVLQEARDRMFSIRTLQEFSYIDENGKDQGAGVREKAKQLVELLNDQQRLNEMRDNAKQTMDKYRGVSNTGSSGYSGFGNDSMGGYGGYSGSSYDNDRRYNDTRDSRDRDDFRGASKSYDPEFPKAKKKEKTKEKEDDTKKKHNKDKEKEKEKKKKKEKSESEEEISEDSDDDSKKKKKPHKKKPAKKPDSEEEEEEKPKPKKKIEVKLSDKSNGSKSKPQKIAGPADDFETNFDDEPQFVSAPAPATASRGQHRAAAAAAPGFDDFDTNFPASASQNDFPAFGSSDDFGGGFSSAPAPAPARQPVPFNRSNSNFPSHAPAASSGPNFFDDPFSQPTPVAQGNLDFDIVSAVSHPKPPSAQGGRPGHGGHDDFSDFTSASGPSQPKGQSAAKPPAKKDQLWDSGLINLSNLSLQASGPKPAEDKKAASSGGSFIDLGPSRRTGGPTAPAPSRPPASNAYGLDSFGLSAPAAPTGYAAPMGGAMGYPPAAGGYGVPPMMGYPMGGMMPPGYGAPMPGMGFGPNPMAGRGRGGGAPPPW